MSKYRMKIKYWCLTRVEEVPFCYLLIDLNLLSTLQVVEQSQLELYGLFIMWSLEHVKYFFFNIKKKKKKKETTALI